MNEHDGEEFLTIMSGERYGRRGFRMTVRRPGEPRRGICTEQRDGENDAETIARLLDYRTANELPVAPENEPLHEI